MSQQTNPTGSSPVQPILFTPFSELYDIPAESTPFVVEGLLPSGGVSVLLGEPKAGKSTLARQLIVSVAQGKKFLGRSCEAAEVLYLAVEEKRTEVRDHFVGLGLQAGDKVHTHFHHLAASNPTAALQAALAQQPSVGLVVIDPIFRFVNGVRDANDYQQVGRAMEQLMEVARKHGTHVLTVHHQKKGDSDDLLDNCLGSTALTAGVDTIIGIVKAKHSPTRTIASRQRYGSDMEPTQLDWNPATRALLLGSTAAAMQESARQVVSDRIISDIVRCVQDRPGITQQQIHASTTGNLSVKKRLLTSLIESGQLVESGLGVQGAPFTYTLAPEYAPFQVNSVKSREEPSKRQVSAD